MRQDPSYFDDQELVLIHIAKRLKEALAVEEHLTTAGISFCVESDEYEGGFLFRTTRTGAFFYVAATDEAGAVETLEQKGIRPLPVELRTHH